MDLVNFFKSWTEQQKRISVGSFSVLAGALILGSYLSSGPSALDYAAAEASFHEWSKSTNDEALYLKMREAFQKTPALEKKYEASIAQKLINSERLNEALIMANRSLTRVRKEVPYHTAYAENSLLIEQGNFQKALENAVALKEEMGQSYLTKLKGGSLLYAHNLIRIACLQQELKNLPGEKAAWEEIEGLLNEKTPLSESLLSCFTEKHISLNQYIIERKKAL